MTATVSWSLDAGEGVRIESHRVGRGRARARRHPGSVALVFASKYCRRFPVYSGYQIDRVVLDRGHVGLATTDTELPSDVEAVGLQRLRVDLGDDLGLGEVRRPDRDRLQIPDISPPPSGFELPQADVTRVRTVATTARALLRVDLRADGRTGFTRESFRRHLPRATLTSLPPDRAGLALDEPTVTLR